MTIDLTPEPHVRELTERVEAFVQEVAIPAEPQLRGHDHGPPEALRRQLQAAARDAGLLAPHVGRDLGGHGLDVRGQTSVFEAAGYSLLGPLALNIAAPDEGNMHLLEKVATPEQRERYLVPLAAGEIRSCFAMTEPAPGAGSDPSMLRTTAEPVAGGWRITGHKWFITGAKGARFAICMAATPEAGGDGATMFLVDLDDPAVEIVRLLDTLDSAFAGGHAEMRFNGVTVGPEAVLGEVGKGFTYAQVRLGPARLTHCMRWLGAARRAHDTALDLVAEREAFGHKLADLGMVQQHLADNEIDLAASRALIVQAAWALDHGQRAGKETSIAKTFVAEAVNRIVDRSIQVCGGVGVSGDLPLAQIMREVRPFRIYDGPSETHRWSLARRAVRARTRKQEDR